MFARTSLALAIAWAVVAQAHAQAVAPAPGTAPSGAWRSTADRIDASPAPGTAGPRGVIPAAAVDSRAAGIPTPAAAPAPRRPIARVTEGTSTLPNTQGQIWREYDLSPYTLRVTTTNRPEQAIVDWILRETGYETWHGEPLAILSATNRTLRVYHTPEMQATVADIVDRFVSSEAETQAFELRVVALDQPNWRTRAQRLLQPVTANTPGVQAWLVKKEDSAMLLSDLRRRSDYRELNRPQLLVNNGQSTGVSVTRGRPYVRDVALRPDSWAGFEAQPAQIDEGFQLEFTPLLSVDRRLIDATLKCDIDQVEKMVPVSLDVPTPANPRQRAQIEVPQIARSRFHERFRWPVEQVLVVNLGMVAMPSPADGKGLLQGLTLGLASTPTRADVLVFVESRGEMSAAQRAPAKPAEREASGYRARF